MKAHLATGLIGGLWLLSMAVTGVLINHQEELGLIDIAIPNSYLPSHYTDEFRPESNPLHVVLTDLHSGRFLGPWGSLTGDLIAAVLVIAVITGARSYWLRRRLR